MAARDANVRGVCAVPTHGMVDDPQFSRSYLAADAALTQLQRSLREQYSLEVQARVAILCRPQGPDHCAYMCAEVAVDA